MTMSLEMNDFSSEAGASEGENAYMLYQERLNDIFCEDADAVHELNPPMSRYDESIMWYAETGTDHPGSPPAAFYSPLSFNTDGDASRHFM
jgi:hypothetical protein